jgi:carbon-monoxide dehydrogenase large subunit
MVSPRRAVAGVVGAGKLKGVEIMSVQAIGQPVRREEDLRLLTGRGRYVDDVKETSEARAYVLRSPHAHARMGALDARLAMTAPGVLAVLTGEDLRRRGLGTLMPGVRRRRRNGAAAFVCPQPLGGIASGMVAIPSPSSS